MKTTNKTFHHSQTHVPGPKTKFGKYMSKMAQKTAKLRAKTANRIAKAADKAAKRQLNAQRGGIRGYFARRLEEKITASQTRQQQMKQRPDLEKYAFKQNVLGENARKLSATRGKALVGVSSALAGGYGASRATENLSSKAKSEAEKAASDLLSKQLESIPTVTTDDYSSGSVSGLLTGVR